jgi:hypothetical protein
MLTTNPFDWKFGFSVYAGSVSDGGIGEETLNVCEIEIALIRLLMAL